MEGSITTALILGVLTSLLATVIWQFTGHFVSSIRTPLDLLASVAGGGVIRKFDNFQDCKNQLDRAIASTTMLKVLAIRGFPLTQEAGAVSAILKEDYEKSRTLEIRVLLAEPDGSEAVYRAAEFSKMSSDTEERYLDQIRGSILDIRNLKKHYPRLSLRMHNEPAAFRVVITDKWCFLGFYTSKWKGFTSPVLLIRRNGILFEGFERFFDRAWARAKEIQL